MEINQNEIKRLDAILKLDRDIAEANRKSAWLRFTHYVLADHILSNHNVCWACDSGKLVAICTCPEAKEHTAKTALICIEGNYFKGIAVLENNASLIKQVATKTLAKLNK